MSGVLSPTVMSSLVQGISALGASVSDEQIEQLCAYLALLLKWNKAYNLTAIRDPQEMVVKHLLDSLSTLPYLSGDRVLDIGTGPGLPGIPLAIFSPHRGYTLLDSNGKKIRFLRQVQLELGLAQIEPVQARVESYTPPQGFDTVISRAFADLADYVSVALPLVTDVGQILAMKGIEGTEHLGEYESRIAKHECIPLNVPGLEAARHLWRIWPKSSARV